MKPIPHLPDAVEAHLQRYDAEIRALVGKDVGAMTYAQVCDFVASVDRHSSALCRAIKNLGEDWPRILRHIRIPVGKVASWPIDEVRRVAGELWIARYQPQDLDDPAEGRSA